MLVTGGDAELLRGLSLLRARDVRSEHVPQHPTAEQLRAAGDQRRGRGRRPAVRPQGERDDEAVGRPTRRSSTRRSRRSRTSPGTSSTTWSPRRPRRTVRSRPRRRAPGRSSGTPDDAGAAPAASTEQEALAFLAERPLVVLTGAGCSTDSGIPDYRGPGRGTPRSSRRCKGSSPPGVMTYQEFVSGPAAQQRYWARSHLGWTRMKGAEPNAGHLALARIDPDLLVTQNVDGLHERAGSRRMVALHGRIADVICLDCREVTARARLHAAAGRAQPRLRRGVARPRGAPRRRRGPRAHGRLPGRGVRDLRRPAEAGRRLLRRERARPQRVERCYAAVDALARPRRRAAGRRVEPGGDERLPVRQEGGEGGDAGRHRQPRGDPGRRPGDVPAGRRDVRVPRRAGGAICGQATESTGTSARCRGA